MGIAGVVILIVLGLLGVASWLRQRQPQAAGPLAQLEGVSGWIGLVGLIWGVVLLVRWIGAISAFSFAPMMMTIALASALVITALSLILAMPIVKALAGANDFTNKLEQTAAKLGPFKVILGAACLVLAVLSLVF